VHFTEIFQKIIITTVKLNFFKFLAFFQSVLVVSYLLIQQRKNSLNYKSFTRPYPCNIDSFNIDKVVESKKLLNLLTSKNCHLFMVRQYFMVALMLNMHGTSNSTAMKFFPTSTSCSIQGK